MTGLQVALELIHAAGIGIGAGRNSQDRFERALQMEGALSEGLAQPSQGDRLIEMLLNVAVQSLHHSHLRISADSGGTAASTSTIAGFLSLIVLAERNDILAPTSP